MAFIKTGRTGGVKRSSGVVEYVPIFEQNFGSNSIGIPIAQPSPSSA